MYLKYCVVCFIGIYLIFLYKCCLIIYGDMIFRIKMARELNYTHNKHRPLMYNKNVKKTFETLCSEITFVMDLYWFNPGRNAPL